MKQVKTYNFIEITKKEFIEAVKLLVDTNYRKMLKEKQKDIIRKEVVYTGKIPTRKEILKIDAIWGLSNNKKDKITVDYNTETFIKITEIAAKTNLKYSQVIRYFLTFFLVKNIDFDDEHLFMKL